MDRRRFASSLVTASAAGLLSSRSRADAPYPNRTARVIVPYPAGGIVDVVIRAAVDRMSANLPQRLIVDNKPGADGRIGMDAAARSAPDGYTLVSATPLMVINEHLQVDSAFRAKDFVGIGAIAAPTSVFVVPESLPVRTMKEFIDYARARPGQLNVPNPGVGSSIHLGQELLFAATGLKVQNVGYKGQPPAIADLVQAQMSFALISQSLVVPHVKSGRLRALAVNATARTASLPDVPTITEAGFPQAMVLSWHGLAAPAKTPASIVSFLSAELQKVMATPEARASLEGLDAEVMVMDAPKFSQLMKEEGVRWGALIRERNIAI